MRRTLTALASIALLGLAAPAPTIAEGLPYNGSFVVNPQTDEISSSQWGPAGQNQHYAANRPVDVTIDSGNNGSVDAGPYTVFSDGTGNWLLDLSGEFDVQPGDLVRTNTAPDGQMVEDTADGYHVVYALTIDGWDGDTDQIWGSSDATGGLQVCVGTQQGNYCMNQWFPEGDPDPWEGDLTWLYQYPDGYIVPGAGIGAVELGDAQNGDNGMTSVDATIPGGGPTPEISFMWPDTGLWDGISAGVSVSGFDPGANVWLTLNTKANPTEEWQMLAGFNVDQNGNWGTQVYLPRYINGNPELDCAPDNCMIVAAQMNDPFNINATHDVTFARLDLYRFIPYNEEYPWEGGEPGDPIIPGQDTVEHGEFIWVQGSGFTPFQQYQLNQCRWNASQCRNTWFAMPWAYSDENGNFGVSLEVGKVMYGPWGSGPTWSAGSTWDLRDGATVMVFGNGLPGEYWEDWPFTYIGAIQTGGWDGNVNIRSDELQFSTGLVMPEVTISQALEQQMEGIVHVAPLPDTTRAVDWDRETGELTYGYTAVSRWLQPPEGEAWDPAPPENGYYDCADVLPYDPASGAREPVHCSLFYRVTETVVDTGATNEAFSEWTPLHFARFDLTATTTMATQVSRPAGVTLRGNVTCTGFSPEQYLVNVEGVLTQTTGGRRPTTRSVPFVVTVTCSGTMSNPGTGYWSVFVPGTFSTGNATVTLEVRSAGFTRNDDPYEVVQTVQIVAPPKGGKR